MLLVRMLEPLWRSDLYNLYVIIPWKSLVGRLKLVEFLPYLFSSDVDECGVGDGGCEHICINSAGSFQCHCFSGYTLVNGSQCEGILLLFAIASLLYQLTHTVDMET